NKKIPLVYQIETYRDLFELPFDTFNRLAITAGASTPSYLVNQVIAYCNAIRDGLDPLEAVRAIKMFV
ncbi:MAG: hypothetical protein JXL85_04140, partial [Bacilli bacterium]|nr:hypothetical protein [Bacilli bacterium]